MRHILRRYLAIGLMAVASAGCPDRNDGAFASIWDPTSPTFLPPLGQSGVMVNDFERGLTVNALGYCPETFTDVSGIAVITPRVTTGGSDAFRGQGSSLRIDFDVAGSGDPFGGYVELLTGNSPCPAARGLFDAEARGVTLLTFWFRRSSADVDVEIAIKSIDPNPLLQPGNDVQTDPKPLLRRYLTGPSTSWVKVRIPLTDLASGNGGRAVDLKNLREVNFGFAKRRFLDNSNAVQGAVFLDEIAFER